VRRQGESLVRGRSESELRPGLTVWINGPRGLKAVVLLKRGTPMACISCGRALCDGWECIGHPTGGGLCSLSAITAGDLFRLRDEEAPKDQTTEKSRDREAVR
jgi:hypothetical protein